MTLSDTRIGELLERARHGDPTATDSLIAGMRPRILRWAVVITGDMDDAEDVAQRVSLAVHRSVTTFAARSRFTTWLYTAVRNAALDLRRQQRANRHVTLDDGEVAALTSLSSDVLAQLSDRARAQAVRTFFEQLSTRQRELIELVDLQGYTPAEAAAALDIEGETARVHLLRARRALRAKMMIHHPEMFE